MPMGEFVWIGVAATSAIGAVWLAIRAIQWARKGSTGGKALAAALFLFPDQPPPNEQVEQQIRLRTDRESGEPKR
jgi:hypothetical protein